MNIEKLTKMELKAFSFFEKGLDTDDAERVITGMATSPKIDRSGDSVDPLGATFAKEIPFLWQHDHNSPIGTVRLGTPTKKGIPFTATIPKVEREGAFKTLVDKAWDAIVHKTVRSVSIGFRTLENGVEYIEKTGGLLFTKTEIFELSAVTVPCQPDATIDTIKSLVLQEANSEAALSATKAKFASAGNNANPLGSKRGYTKSTPVGVKIDIINKENNKMSTLQEQLDAAKTALTAKKDFMSRIMKDADGATLDAEQAELHDEALSEAKELKSHISRLEAQQELEADNAEPVGEVKSVKTGAAARGGIQVTRNLPKGTIFTRTAIATALAKGNPMHAVEIAKARYTDTPEVEGILKAAVGGVTTGDAAVGLDRNFSQTEFLELLRGQTIFDRVEGKRRVPFDTKIRVGANAATAYWVGEGQPKPVSKPGLSEVELKRHKLASIVVLSEEAIQRTGWATEAWVRDEMIKAIVETMDVTFLDGGAGTANRPAAINNGLTATAATGVTFADFNNDMQALYDNLADANLDPNGLTWLLNPKRAGRISRLRNAFDQKEYDSLSARGGELDDSPALTSTRVTDTDIFLMKPDSIFYAQDDNMILRSSNEASIIMSDNPAVDGVSADGTAQPVVLPTSMFQTNQVALLVEQFVTWIRGRDEAVQQISGAGYGG